MFTNIVIDHTDGIGIHNLKEGDFFIFKEQYREGLFANVYLAVEGEGGNKSLFLVNLNKRCVEYYYNIAYNLLYEYDWLRRTNLSKTLTPKTTVLLVEPINTVEFTIKTDKRS